ncbi:MAG: bacteriohemerythrin [Alphaproteobacteria bacterium]|nr:bacteriohemerythrin [Alphaproteobacteria bacterium]
MASIVTIEIEPGIIWLAVPDADLRILCGCPADSVKHLMRRGLIRPINVGGVMCETGPNAILLSDVMVQNGEVCNLAEFPVLQMFYRQGLLLPGHPNNSGAKPILIGRREQVEAQMQYIYRGNYGLISDLELMEAGVPVDQAREMMRLKLKFAFGRIQHPRELLNGLILDDRPMEIKNGVTIRRVTLNVFEVSYGDETATIDLNLAPHRSHDCPYPLGSFQFRRDYFAVVHLGEGDGWDIRRPSMGSVVVFQGRVYLVDAGPNLDHSLTALGIGINEIEGIFHTHGHDDHFAGLTSLMQADHRIKYFAVPMVRHSVAKKLSALLSIEESEFHEYFDVHDLVLGQWNDIDGMDVKPLFSPHPVENTIFQFRAMGAGGLRTYAHYADLVSLSVLKGFVTDDETKPGLSQAALDQVVANYHEPADIKKVDIGGGMIHGVATDFIADTSGKILLAHTAQALTPEQKRIGSGASFGTVDVLISAHRDFLGRTAFKLLTAYFPQVNPDHIEAILNGPMRMFNPETIIYKNAQPQDCIYLLLTGQVEMLDEDGEARAALSAGALLGEMTGLHGLPAAETCRAVSFVQVLEIPCDVYTTFVLRHQLFSGISTLMEGREFLSRTWLLGGVVSTGTLNALTKSMRRRVYEAGSFIDHNERAVGLIRSGRVSRVLGGEVIETLGAGEFFGEEAAVFDAPGIARLRTEEPTEIHSIPANLLGAIPNVRWKLFETFERRNRQESSVSQAGRTMLAWNDEYSINIQQIDAQHRRLFATANHLLDAVESERSREEVAAALDFLITYTKYHFAEEEALMQRYGYSDTPEHKQRHVKLTKQVLELEERIAREPVQAVEVLEFLHDWIVTHILIEDRKYAAALNAAGVY